MIRRTSYIEICLLFEFDEYLFFKFRPAMERDLVSFEAEPFEKTRVSSGSRDQRRDHFPTFQEVMNVRHGNVVSLAMLANQPNQDFQVADTPVSL